MIPILDLAERLPLFGPLDPAQPSPMSEPGKDTAPRARSHVPNPSRMDAIARAASLRRIAAGPSVIKGHEVA